MKLTFKVLSTRSGKAMVININDKTYLFNLFQGFQRYCIEAKQSITSITAFFLTDKFNVPQLSATYLSLLGAVWKGVDVISNFNVDFDFIHPFARSPLCALNFKDSFSDKFISVKMLESDGKTNFLISFKKIRGRIFPERINTEIPKSSYKKLIKNEFIEIENKIFFLKDFSEPEIQLNDVVLLFDKMDYKNIPKTVKCFFCFTFDIYISICKEFQHNVDSSDNLFGIYYVSDNNFIEYEGFYDQQVLLNEKDKNFKLPHIFNGSIGTCLNDSNGKHMDDSTSNNGKHMDDSTSNNGKHMDDSIGTCLNTGDILEFDSKIKYFDLKRKFNKIPNHNVIDISQDQTPLIQSSATECVIPASQDQTPSIQFLGTGCAIPSKYRNVSSILYENEKSAILLDCGEDTLFQIERLKGNFEVLNKIEIIYISHSHADHMLGISSLINLCSRHVTVVGPEDCFRHLTYFGLDKIPSKFSFISTKSAKAKSLLFYENPTESAEANPTKSADSLSNPTKSEEANPTKSADSLLNPIHFPLDAYVTTFQLGDFTFNICGCIHSRSSTSVSIFDSFTKKSFSYSGDTIPSKLFAYISMGVDVMIHEATFLSGQEEAASKTVHSLKSQAIEIFKQTNSRQLLLTHFSNRNKYEEILNEEMPEDVCCVTDFYVYNL